MVQFLRLLETVKKELINTTTFRVRFSEVDSLRIVWHGNYFHYFEDGRDAWGTQFGLNFIEIYETHGLLLPLVKTNINFKLPLHYNELGLVETTFITSPAAKVIFGYRIFDEQRKQLKAEGETVQIFMDKNNVLQLNTPDFFEEWKRKQGLK